MRAFLEFYNSGVINQSINVIFTALAPKKSQIKKISNFRPISLTTCLYKIIAKIFSKHIQGVLHETIHVSQGAFVQGKQILNAMLIANEIVDEKKCFKEEEVVFRIDFKKVYNHVDWGF